MKSIKRAPTSFQKLKEKLKKEKMRSSTVPCPIEKDANDHSDNERTMLIKNEAVKVHNANAETEDVFDEDDDQKANEKHKKSPYIIPKA